MLADLKGVQVGIPRAYSRGNWFLYVFGYLFGTTPRRSGCWAAFPNLVYAYADRDFFF